MDDYWKGHIIEIQEHCLPEFEPPQLVWVLWYYIVIQVAFQPTACGGLRHFGSGNGRIVCQARRLLDDKNPDSHAMYIAHKVEAKGSPEFSRNAWTEIMEELMS